MDFKEDIKRFAPLLILGGLAILSFFLIKPFIIPIIGGLLLAYAFNPVYKWIKKFIPSRSLSAAVTLLLMLIIIALPLWFVTPILMNQAFGLFKAIQSLNLSDVISKFFPTASPDFIAQMTVTSDSLISKLNSVVLNTLGNLFLNAITLIINLFIACFVFFYALKDSEKLEEIIKKLSPLSKDKEKIIKKQFDDITSAVIYGQVLIGLVQGAFAGVGLFLFGVPHALVLTAAAIILSMIPILGPGFIWVPAAVYLFSTGEVGVGIAFLAYNILIVSTVDNILRTYLVSRKMNMSSLLVLLGMIGGLFLFGVLGIILGPLILAYLITFWQLYRNSGQKSIVVSETPKKKFLLPKLKKLK